MVEITSLKYNLHTSTVKKPGFESVTLYMIKTETNIKFKIETIWILYTSLYPNWFTEIKIRSWIVEYF